MTANVVLTLQDGTELHITRAAIEEAAQRLPVGDQTRIEVDVNGRRVDAINLVARAAGVSSDRFRPRAAYEALKALHFDADPRRRSTDAAKVQQRHLEDSLSWPDSNEAPEGPVFTPELAQRLQRHRGKWVAVRSGEVIASALTLHELREQTADMEELSIPVDRLVSGDLRSS